ncbi:MAG: hypothetical protein HFACDABA_02739 [Anaerolineales bacterium]|nr:hypothetical protein [Anaerolineales bacterium]
MVEKAIFLIYVVDSIFLIVLVVGIAWWQRAHGKLSANKFAALITGYFSFLFISTLSPRLITHTQTTLIVDVLFLVLLWCIGFPWFRWIYSHFYSPK